MTKLPTILLLLFLSPTSTLCQSAFYSNDLSEKDIWNLIENKRKWEEEANRLQLKLDQANALSTRKNRTDEENTELKSINQGLFKDKERLQTVLYFTQLQLEHTKEEINTLKNQKRELQDRINILKDKEREYRKSIIALFRLIQNLDAQIEQLQDKVDKQNYIIFNQNMELRRTVLNLSKIGSDLLFAQTRGFFSKRLIYSSLRDNSKTISLKTLKKKGEVFVKAQYYLSPEEWKKVKKNKVKAQISIYEMGGTQTLTKQSFNLKPLTENSTPLLIELLGEDYKAYEPGQLVSGMGKIAIAGLIKRKKIDRGSYYYILEIDDKIRLSDRFEVY